MDVRQPQRPAQLPDYSEVCSQAWEVRAWFTLAFLGEIDELDKLD